MLMNNDVTKRVVIRPEDYRWTTTEAESTQHTLLDQSGIDGERATMIVRYPADAVLVQPSPAGGEEFLVLEGALSDEWGAYPVGTYVRSPAGRSRRRQVGENGATVFIKRGQLAEHDSAGIHIDTSKTPWHLGQVPGLSVMPLHSFEGEHAALVKWAPYTEFVPHRHFGGEEIYVLQGTFHDEHGVYPAGSWLRSPHLSAHHPFTKEDGALIYVKTGHL
ncbi:MAG: cupin domain-containing protein [Kordiimonadaceae bacterium]|nr:cupin domain-containing protein [Kordiimonadaceae bacterium]MBO6569563.1 cupin domain-containing protein [Kordiimonadaceae bacterium]MBO6965038.1 cupin domain-containing protein [Kordiimonadaceae bacterium]